MSIPSRNGQLPASIVEPSPPARGAIVVIQEAFGVTDHIRTIAVRLADEGYLAVAPHMFHRSGDPVLAYGDMAAVDHQSHLDDHKALSDVDGVLAYLRDRGWADRQIGVVGFCMGGRIAFLVALERSIGAAVTFYGGGIVTQIYAQFPPLIGRSAELRTSWLGLFGDQDHVISPADVEALREATRPAKVPVDIIRYADAGHGFNCDDRADYRPEAARDAWARTLAWLGARLPAQVGAPT
jgi:carboxymethylenebutenolidase